MTFPETPVGGASVAQTILITNSGASPTGTIATEVSGFVFEITSDTCTGVSLAAGGFCTISVRFEPTASGSRSGALGVSAMPGGGLEIWLSGVGL